MRTDHRIFWLVIGLFSLIAIFGCNGVDPCEVSEVACRTTCEGECVSVDGCLWTCKTPEPPPPPPPPPDPCDGVTCECGTCTDGVCPECPPPPPEEFKPPTFAELEAQGVKTEIKIARRGRKGLHFTPKACFGKDYYCDPRVGWPEACADGKRCGPVAGDGHPKRVQWEQHVIGQKCVTVSVPKYDMSIDPWISLNGVNQNHPQNVEICEQPQFEDGPSVKKYEMNNHLYIYESQLTWATFHGDGEVCAEGKDGVARTCFNYVEQ